MQVRTECRSATSSGTIPASIRLPDVPHRDHLQALVTSVHGTLAVIGHTSDAYRPQRFETDVFSFSLPREVLT